MENLLHRPSAREIFMQEGQVRDYSEREWKTLDQLAMGGTIGEQWWQRHGTKLGREAMNLFLERLASSPETALQTELDDAIELRDGEEQLLIR